MIGLKRFEDLKGHVLASVEVSASHDGGSNDIVTFTLETGEVCRLYHEQDCCESVAIEDINGDLEDLIGANLGLAEEATSDTNPSLYTPPEWGQDSFTWTFYKLATVKGYVTIRWYGESNGYYSESVDFKQLEPARD